ncbi:hypothetical protein ACL02U_00300 [Streptomyces sp. MS06]|uniref:polysaccharide biosynthesis C-terminal domain-containing protein n=1 Tax=Streptomyces sp. MS06 TaxID=3385974 RepID=UPI0039A22E55
MSSVGLEFLELDDTGDGRGSSFAVPPDWLAGGSPVPVRDLHATTVRPGCVRGNHFHRRRHEILVVMPCARWSLHWDSGDGTDPVHRTFAGTSAVVVRIPPGVSHAVRNEADRELTLLGICDEVYEPGGGETVRREVTR